MLYEVITMAEYEIEAELIYEFKKGGSAAPAYPPIVAGGANSCILHYTRNDAQLHDGELLLIDAGAEIDCYAADITRTFPVNGKFSGEQKALYEVVLVITSYSIHYTKLYEVAAYRLCPKERSDWSPRQ